MSQVRITLDLVPPNERNAAKMVGCLFKVRLQRDCGSCLGLGLSLSPVPTHQLPYCDTQAIYGIPVLRYQGLPATLRGIWM